MTRLLHIYMEISLYCVKLNILFKIVLNDHDLLICFCNHTDTVLFSIICSIIFLLLCVYSYKNACLLKINNFNDVSVSLNGGYPNYFQSLIRICAQCKSNCACPRTNYILLLPIYRDG